MPEKTVSEGTVQLPDGRIRQTREMNDAQMLAYTCAERDEARRQVEALTAALAGRRDVIDRRRERLAELRAERFSVPADLLQMHEKQNARWFGTAIDHPSHYTAHPSGVECIDVVEHLPFCLGNAIKYLWRAGQKGPAIEDLKKALWYLERDQTSYVNLASTRLLLIGHKGHIAAMKVVDAGGVLSDVLRQILRCWNDGGRMTLDGIRVCQEHVKRAITECK